MAGNNGNVPGISFLPGEFSGSSPSRLFALQSAFLSVPENLQIDRGSNQHTAYKEKSVNTTSFRNVDILLGILSQTAFRN